MAKKVAKKATKKTKTTSAAAESAVKKKAKKAAAPKVKKKRVSRKKKAVIIRRKLFWGVFNHGMKRVALYEHNQKKAADKRAKELEESSGKQHFVAKVKEEIAEAVETSSET